MTLDLRPRPSSSTPTAFQRTVSAGHNTVDQPGVARHVFAAPKQAAASALVPPKPSGRPSSRPRMASISLQRFELASSAGADKSYSKPSGKGVSAVGNRAEAGQSQLDGFGFSVNGSGGSRDADVWRCTKTSCDFRLPSDLSPSTFFPASQYCLNFTTLAPSISTLIAQTPVASSPLPASALFPRIHGTQAVAYSPIHDSFHSYDAIVSILRSFALAFPNAEMIRVGLTSEGRDIVGLKIRPLASGDGFRGKKSKERKKKGATEKEWVVVGGTHAREWISTSTVIYLAHSLLLSPPIVASESLRRLRRNRPLTADDDVSDFTYTLIPTLNPDGYEYTWTTDRLWRKNRQSNPSEDDPPDNSTSTTDDGSPRECLGVDLNRNWGYHFAPPPKGRRTNPCSDSFPGHEAFSSRETRALADYISPPPSSSTQRKVVGYLDLHSYSQQILFPYAYTCAKPPSRAEDLWEAVYGAAKAIRMVHGRSYEVGGRCDVSYAAPGDSIDWVYGAAKVHWAFAAELRDLGTFGFLLPPNQIRPQGEEALAMLKSLVQFVMEKEGP